MAIFDSTAGGSAGNPIPIKLAYESQTWDGALSVQPLLGPHATFHDLTIVLDLEVADMPPGLGQLTVDSALDLALRLIGAVAQLRRQSPAS